MKTVACLVLARVANGSVHARALLTAPRAVLLLLLPGRFLLYIIGVTHAQAPAELSFTLKLIGPNVWAAIDVRNPKAPAGANAGFVIGDDGVAVIDTFATVEAAKQLLAEIRKLTKLPVKFVINTHYHGDHVGGNGIFMETGAVVLAHRNVRGWIHPENLKLFGKDVTPEQKALIEALVAPTAVYDQAVDLYLGSREIPVRSFPGHTGGDSVVFVPDAKIAFGGDLVWRNTAQHGRRLGEALDRHARQACEGRSRIHLRAWPWRRRNRARRCRVPGVSGDAAEAGRRCAGASEGR